MPKPNAETAQQSFDPPRPGTLYSMSALISMRRMRYISRKYLMSSSLVAVTVVLGGSTLWAVKGFTCGTWTHKGSQAWGDASMLAIGMRSVTRPFFR